MNENQSEKIIEIVNAEGEKDRYLKFIRFDLRDFRDPRFKKTNWNERLVYWLIWFRSNDSKRQTWITDKQISEELHIPYETTKDIVPRLKRKKFIKIESSKFGRRFLTALIDLR